MVNVLRPRCPAEARSLCHNACYRNVRKHVKLGYGIGRQGKCSRHAASASLVSLSIVGSQRPQTTIPTQQLTQRATRVRMHSLSSEPLRPAGPLYCAWREGRLKAFDISAA